MRGVHPYWAVVGVFLLSLAIGFLATAEAQEDPLAKIEARIELLEKRLEIKEELAGVAKELREQRFELIEQKYAQALQTLRNEQEAFKNDIREKNQLIYLIWAAILLFGVGSPFVVLRWAKNKTAEYVEEVLKTGSANLRQLIETQTIENRLKKEKRLLLISGTEKHLKEMEKQFQLMKFEQVESRLLSNVFDLERTTFSPDFHEEKYDLIVFNQLTSEEIDLYIDRSVLDAFVGFSYEQLKVKHREKLNFANSLFTLYARTMEVLKYQAVIENQ